jgi:hypothetical protein
MVFSALLFCFAGFCCFRSYASASEQQIQYFPQFADGGGYTTAWHFIGYGSGPSSIEVEIFDGKNTRQVLATDQGTGSIFQLSLNGYGSASLRTLGSGSSVKSGWVRITSTPTVGVTETYKYVGSGGLISQAAVLPSNPIGSATLFVSDARNTAIALLNTGSSNTLSFRLLDKNGNTVGAASTYPLQPGNQLALYVNQIPGFENTTLLDGSIEVSASSSFYLTTLVFEGQNFATAPVLPGRSEPAGYRNDLLNQFNLLLQQSAVPRFVCCTNERTRCPSSTTAGRDWVYSGILWLYQSLEGDSVGHFRSALDLLQ